MTSFPGRKAPTEGTTPRGNLLGVVLAGGGSRRFGGEKALFPIGGRAMAWWSIQALEPWTERQVVITSEAEVAEALGIPGYPDRIPGLGPIGGLHTALTLARDDGRDGIFLLACDLPLVTSGLVGRILRAWPPGASAVVPMSPGPLGFEPLCAGYSVGCLGDLEDAIQTGRRSMEDAMAGIGGHRVPLAGLGPAEELESAFTNVNTREAAQAVEGWIRNRTSSPEGFGEDPEPESHSREEMT